MSSSVLTLKDCVAAVNHALDLANAIVYREGSWNAEHLLIREHCLGSASAGATVYKCAVGYNIDFDLRCDQCGDILAMGSVDIDGPRHGAANVNEPVVLARSVSELYEALGAPTPSRRSPPEAASFIFERLRVASPCPCTG